MNQWYMIFFFFFLYVSSRLADTPLQEHESSSTTIPTRFAILVQKKFRSAIQKKNTVRKRTVCILAQCIA